MASAVLGAGDSSLSLARAQSWEDPALWAALDVRAGDEALVFEPSGDDALGVAAAGAAAVTVGVPDPAARALVALKIAAARELPVQSVRSLLGLGHFGRRVWFYHYLRPGLAPEDAAVLDAHEATIRAGLAAAGAVERAMATFRERVLPLAVGGNAVPGLLAAADPAPVVRARWSGLRWRAAARVWAPRLAALAGAPAEGAAARLVERLERPSHALEWLLTGAWRNPDGAHPWLAAAGLAALKPRLGGVRVVTGTRIAALERGDWTLVLLGRAPLSAEEGAALARALRPGGRALGWGPPPRLPPSIGLDTEAGARLAALDRGLFPGTPWVARR